MRRRFPCTADNMNRFLIQLYDMLPEDLIPRSTDPYEVARACGLLEDRVGGVVAALQQRGLVRGSAKAKSVRITAEGMIQANLLMLPLGHRLWVRRWELLERYVVPIVLSAITALVTLWIRGH